MRIVSIFAMAALLTGCGTVGRIKQIGLGPAMSPAENAVAPAIESSIGRSNGRDRVNPVAAQQQAGAASPVPPPAQSASLFRDGAGSLFQDQRARRIGDILTIHVLVADSASFANTTSRQRNGSESAGIASLFGLDKLLPGDPSKLVNANSGSNSGGQGQTARNESIDMTLAAIVVDVQPNGNLVIRGKQEMRVNYELRDLVITGIIRPQDISRDNTISHTKLADARIAYGGRGHLTDLQQARYGQQIFDTLFPF
ncbi:flagellar basal body L-ring protein FlgH [Sphingorhabdus sp. M41]|uniref:flagellar basal body L-ring protein FlgH n=1 Tax=Sphingorhabdus sp. M41 TaxID=1806885 RepID=UPI00078DAB9E|nr:flagellar basal body L-ring protein FlgH [Sphingorhabdus sp. M41]AMO72601.1 flagellar basal body L-ring protein [Sphingorhabdus sp. M41]